MIYEVVVRGMRAKINFYELMTLWGYPMVAGVWPSSDHRKSVVDSTISFLRVKGLPLPSSEVETLHFLIYCKPDGKKKRE